MALALMDKAMPPIRPGLAYEVSIPTDRGDRHAAAIEYERRVWVVVSWAPTRVADSFVPARMVPITALGEVQAECAGPRSEDVTFHVLDVVPSAVLEPALPLASRVAFGVVDDPPSVFRYRLPDGELVGTPTR